MLEIEAKIKIKNREELVSKVGGLVQKSKDHVTDIYFDKGNELKSLDTVLRLRKHNDTAFITYKGSRISDRNLLVREEYETPVASFDIVSKIVRSLGYAPSQITEKTRERFAIENSDVKIELDQYPFIGYYLEIEGTREDVLLFMETYGYSMDDAIVQNCTELFYDYIAKEGIKLSNPSIQFTFEDEEKYFSNQKL